MFAVPDQVLMLLLILIQKKKKLRGEVLIGFTTAVKAHAFQVLKVTSQWYPVTGQEAVSAN